MYDIEVTDTFGGEANYCWVRRGTTKGRTKRQLFRDVRSLAGWPISVRVDTHQHGECLVFRPRGLCQVAFVTTQD